MSQKAHTQQGGDLSQGHAEVGLGLKSRDSGSRALLFTIWRRPNVPGVLEM